MLIEGPSRNGAFGRQMRMDAGFSACNLAQLRPPYVAELTGARLSRMLKEMGPWELVVKWLDVMPMKL